MRLNRMLALGASVLVLLSACSTGGGGKATVRIGSDGFYEAKLVAEIYAQALEAKGWTVDRAGIGIGGRPITAPALESGQFDLKPEYIGSGLGFYDPSKVSSDPAAERAALQAILASKGGGITVLDHAPASDQNVFVVRLETANQFSLSKLSDVAPVQDRLKWGLATECPTNPLCAAALKAAYGLEPPDVTLLSACDQPMVDALANETIDVGQLCSTQPDAKHNGWVVLDDDKKTQPAENIAPLVRNDYLAKVDQAAFKQILNDVSAKLTTEGLLAMNEQYVFEQKDLTALASQWLKDNGFTT